MDKGLSNSVGNIGSQTLKHATLFKDAFNKSKKDITRMKMVKNKKTGKKTIIQPTFIAINPTTNTIMSFRDEKKLMKQLKIKNKPSISIKKDRVVKGYSFLRFTSPKEAKDFVNEYNSIDNIDTPILTQTQQKVHHKFGHTNTEYALDLETELKEKGDMNTALTRGIEEKIKDVNDKDKIRVMIETDGGWISTPYMYKKDFIEEFYDTDIGFFNFSDMMEETDMETGISSGASVSIGVQTGISGGRGLVCSDKAQVYNKKSLLRIKNTDDLCLGRCIVCEQAQRDNHPKKQQIREGRKIQTELTHKLYEDAGIEKNLADLDTIRAFEKYLDCSITIIDGDQFNNVVYPDIDSDDYEVKDFNIYVYKNKNHFDLINSNRVAGFFGKTFFCSKCKKTHTTRQHKCKYKCNLCCKSDCDCVGVDFSKKTFDWKDCKKCFRWFPTDKCFQNHQIASGKTCSPCNTLWKCPDCKKNIFWKDHTPETHICGTKKCKNCGQEYTGEHKCYMMPKHIQQPSDKYIYFDFECDITTPEHQVNYCVAQYHDKPESFCFTSLDEFCEWAFDAEKHKGYTFIAHNGRGYDFQLVMKWVYEKTSLKPFTIYAGSKIMTFSVEKEYKIRFLDSLNFLTMKLETFPKTFGIKELKKGFYPYWFNTAENFNYIGEMPERKLFTPNKMSIKKRKEFNDWYDEKVKNNYVWNHLEETKTYCISDVDILRRSCEIFRNLYLEVADIDPFRYTTIASVCMAIYRANYIIPDYNELYWNAKQEGDEFFDEFKEWTTNKVFDEKKIGIFDYKQQEFIRKSFFGGRTNAIKLKYTFEGTEEGKYADITSLYPTTNYYDEYPLGHPEIITENFKTFTGDEYYGFIDCDVVCPKDLYFPVLARKGEKLLFDLEDKRGIWTTIELKKAIEKGYKITKIYEVYHFDKRSNDLFKPYVSKFLKIKQEASGFPDWVKTDEDKLKYIEKYHKEQGILLNINNIGFNAGLRAIAKLCLNSLWGKFGQRTNMPITEVVNDKAKYNNIMFNDKYKDHNLFFIDDERVEINYRVVDEYIENSVNTNIAIASFTTSSARLRLYYGLNLLNHQVLYHDTDSIVYKYDKNNPNHNELPLGDNLGEWTDELEGKKMIGTYVSGGPKNYSYETDDGEYHTKIKGFTLNYDACKVLNHNNMINMIDQYTDEGEVNKLQVDYDMIQRHKDKKLTNYKQYKQYGFCYDKRVIQEPDENGNIDTLPIGFYQN